MALQRIKLPTGEVTDPETYKALQLVSTIVGIDLLSKVTQGSWSTRVEQSGSTHSGAGVVDIANLSEAQIDKVVAAWRMTCAGRGTGWKRLPSQGNWPLHAHLVLVTSETAESAINQYKSYLKGGNGLSGNTPDDGPRDWVSGSSNALLGDGFNILPNATNVSNPLESAASFISFLSNPRMQLRLVLFIVGLILIIIALFRISNLSANLDTVTELVTK